MLRGLSGKTGLELRFRFDLLSQFRSVWLTPLRKCLPKSCHVLKRAKGPCLGLPVPKGAHRKAPRHREHSELLGCTPSLKTSCWLSSWAKLGQRKLLMPGRQQGPGLYWPQTANLSPTNPPPGFSQPLTPPPTNTLSLSLSQSLSLFPPLHLPLPISHPLVFCPPVHNLHLSSQLLPAFTVFKRTF